MAELHENVFTYWVAGDEWMRLLREEQAHLVEGWGGRTETLMEDGNPVDYVILEEGCLTYATGFAIVDESDMKEEVYDLLNFIYERENAVSLSLGHNYPVQLEGPPEEITERFDYVESPDDVVWFNWEEILPIQDEIEGRFDQIKSL
ncbi:hypothetical protein [Natronolimnohabitans innermongolicus]